MNPAVVKLELVAQTAEKQPIGILASLSTGFDTVTRQLGLLLLPAALDVFLWLGPRLKAASLWALVEFEIPSGLDAQTRLFAQDLQTRVRQAIESFNWLSALRPTLLGVPGLMDGTAALTPAGVAPPEVQVDSPGSLAVIVLLLAVVGIGLGGLQWSLIARQVRDGRIDWGAALGRMSVIWPRLIGLGLLVIGSMLAVWLGAVLITLLLGAVFEVLSTLAVMLALSLMIWLLFYFTFGLHGIVLYNQRVLDAVRTSFRLGRAQFWSVFGMILALIAVEWGMGLIWRLAPMDSWLWAVAIFGDAFVVAGVSLATMLFYLDRVPIPSSALAA